MKSKHLLRSIPFAALLALLPSPARAETTTGPAIGALPVTISKSGVYHLNKNLEYTAATGPGININANDVVIDMNSHGLIATSGSTTAATGIYSSNFNRITVKNGYILGFRYGIYLNSNVATVTGINAISNYLAGIIVDGNNAQILKNNVVNTGGSPPATVSAIGIDLSGTCGTVSDNDVHATYTLDLTGHYGDGIRLDGCSQVVVSNNRVLDVEPSTPTQGASTGIALISSSNMMVLGNIVTTSQIGFDLSGGASGEYGDNNTSGVSTGYNTNGSGMTNIGNNN